jgi:CheY-like chemotaxis protein
MSPETIEKAFEPFFTTKGIGKGTGLGLSTVHGIVKAAGGTISIRSAPGSGSSVTILLPVSKQEPSSINHPSPKHAPAQPQANERSEASVGAAFRILLVEDNPAVLDVNRRALLAAGHRVSVASDGEIAQRLVESLGPFDVIVTDIVMPVMTGFELADRVRRKLPGQRFVFVSGYAEEALRERGVTPAEMDILQKPFSPQALVERLKRL